MKQFILSMLISCISSYGLFAQPQPNPQFLGEKWESQWTTYPDMSLFDYGVYHFRKTLDLAQQPTSFVINVSADNRYRLFVNGQPVCWGPARGDVLHWYFETIDIAPFLNKGTNTLAAVVCLFHSMKLKTI
ncbi:hypothetical protein EZS27_031188 [termite gut metagenome]|uniref:Bacterial alpha-L-rhamnosidase N-terminal domain-containing protein n=1 Tax=termite gut metagenome TaxID=433724 RepID=A0A5J4QCG6_9ZZZZ